MSVDKSFQALKTYCEKEGFKGYDPYDGLNSKLFQASPFKKSRFFRLAWIQLFKRLPLNIRPLVGIRKEHNPKGLALFIMGYANMYKNDPREEVLDKIKELADTLLSVKTQGYSGDCWGYNFDWQARAFFQPKGMPTVVATSYCGQAMIKAFELSGEQRYLDSAISAAEFVLQDLNQFEGKDGSICFSYSPLDNTQVYNASLLGVRLLSQVYKHSKEEKYIHTAEKAVKFALQNQQEDGSWFYSPLSHHQWVDSFHTGFNLECLQTFYSVCPSEELKSAIEDGLTYYLDNFFEESGRPKYYDNKVYPIDMHATAQFIVTLDALNKLDDHKVLAEKVMGWSIDNMQSEEGYFYFQQQGGYTNKISYMRWTQAWMFEALAILFSKGNDS